MAGHDTLLQDVKELQDVKSLRRKNSPPPLASHRGRARSPRGRRRAYRPFRRVQAEAGRQRSEHTRRPSRTTTCCNGRRRMSVDEGRPGGPRRRSAPTRTGQPRPLRPDRPPLHVRRRPHLVDDHGVLLLQERPRLGLQLRQLRLRQLPFEHGVLHPRKVAPEQLERLGDAVGRDVVDGDDVGHGAPGLRLGYHQARKPR